MLKGFLCDCGKKKGFSILRYVILDSVSNRFKNQYHSSVNVRVLWDYITENM